VKKLAVVSISLLKDECRDWRGKKRNTSLCVWEFRQSTKRMRFQVYRHTGLVAIEARILFSDIYFSVPGNANTATAYTNHFIGGKRY
jgi:hypothetical protein